MALNAVDSLIDDVSPPPEANKTSSKNIYSIGDVVRVNVMRKINTVTRLARIRALDVDNALLHMLNNDDPTDNDQKQENHIGVEYFNWKVHSNSPYNTDLITDGIINGVKIFDVKKEGYGAFIKPTNIVGSAVWTKSKSKKALKLEAFDNQTFIKAAKYGSMPVIQHMLQMPDYPQDPSIIAVVDKTDSTGAKYSKYLKYSALCTAISGNHYDIVQLLLDKHLDPKPQPNIDNATDDIKYNPSNEYILPKLRVFKARRNTDVLRSTSDKNTKFYNPSLFDKLCKESNIKMLALLLERDAWPVYYRQSHGLYEAVAAGDLEVVRLLLAHAHDPEYINLPLYRNLKGRTLIPQTNLNLLNVAISHHRLDIVEYVVTRWKYKDVVIKNQCIYHPTMPHILPALLFTILDCHLRRGRIAFTCECIELLTRHCDPIDIGLNWVCNKTLGEQENIIVGDISNNVCVHERVLNVNRTLCLGSLLSALVYKCQALWAGFRAYDDVKEDLRREIERLISLLVQNGIDWNLATYDLNIKNIIMKYTTYPHYRVTDLDVDICDDEDFVLFFRNTVSKSIETFRKVWLDAFLNFYKEDKLMANIFKWYVMDFVVPRKDILDSIKYFTIKSEEEKAKEKETKSDKDDPDYIDWTAEDNDGQSDDEQ